MIDNIKIACLQYNALQGEYYKNRDTVANILLELKNEKPDIIVLPELSLNGHYYNNEKNKLSEFQSGETFNFFKEYSREWNAMFVVCINEKIEDEELCYSTSLLIDRGKLIGSYRKKNPPSIEKVFVKPGNSKTNIFKTRFGNIMLLTCYDMSISKNYVNAYDENVDLVLISNAWIQMSKMPFSTSKDYEHHTILPRAIAMQLRCPVAVSNLVGNSEFIVLGLPMYGERLIKFSTNFCGNSMICDYMGNISKKLDSVCEGYVISNVNLKLGQELRKLDFTNYGDNLYFNYINK